MQRFASACKRSITLVALFTLALVFALPLAANAHADGVFASIRLYDGIDPADLDTIKRHAEEGFLPIISASEGFIAFYWLPMDDSVAAINFFASAEEAAASNDAASDYVADHNLASLLPNAPRIVEGAVDISVVEALDGMADAAGGGLYASLRIYDGFKPDNLDDFVTTVEDGLLPQLRETDGFFGYYVLQDGAGALAAISIFDVEASALASNEKARDFVAENLAPFLPSAPRIISGRLGIAVLAELNNGANLIDNMMMDEGVFASVRVYDGVNPADQDEIARLTNEGFLPIMRESAGFIGYYLLPADDVLAAISLFGTAEQAAASSEAARDFVAENLAPFLPNAPRVVEGALSINYVAALRGLDDHGAVDALYASIRFYEGFDLAHFDEANDLAVSHLLPALQELGGLFALFALNDGEDTVVGISIFDSEEASLAANDVGKAFTIDYLADWSPNPPTGFNATVRIAALAEINMGENLLGAMME